MPAETHSLEKGSLESTEKSGPVMLSSLKEYNQKQKEEILGPANRYFTGKALGRVPTPEEATAHFLEYGGAEDFAKRYTYPSREKH
jgi:hypothetical protein